jgi:hypothetical protein
MLFNITNGSCGLIPFAREFLEYFNIILSPPQQLKFTYALEVLSNIIYSNKKLFFTGFT